MHATRTDGQTDGRTPDRCITLRAGSCGRRRYETRTVRTFLSVDSDSFRRFLGEDGASVVKRERGVVREDRASHRVDRKPIEIVGSDTLSLVVKRLHPSSTMVHPSLS